mgnify:CR=1 FL=1
MTNAGSLWERAGADALCVERRIQIGDGLREGADAIGKARQAGGVVVAALVLIDREEGGREAIEAELNGAPLYALFGAAELLG